MGSEKPDSHHTSEPEEASLHIFQAHPTIRVSEKRIRAVAEAIASEEKVRWEDVNVVLVNHTRLRELNRDWLEHDDETDVLSFLLDGGALRRVSGPEGGVFRSINGEVYVDVETAEERAPEFEATTEDEVLRYVAHGLLHLCGHDDANDEEREAMRQLENTYLNVSSSRSDSS